MAATVTYSATGLQLTRFFLQKCSGHLRSERHAVAQFSRHGATPSTVSGLCYRRPWLPSARPRKISGWKMTTLTRTGPPNASIESTRNGRRLIRSMPLTTYPPLPRESDAPLQRSTECLHPVPPSLAPTDAALSNALVGLRLTDTSPAQLPYANTSRPLSRSTCPFLTWPPYPPPTARMPRKLRTGLRSVAASSVAALLS
ncbi:hypothetical protein B0H14DRAFT_1703112 [Mycena olivaceomarginata]|nr:hypothetical protein B0H14DRAFT_1703112 [Mycena olivaceomarginata]